MLKFSDTFFPTNKYSIKNHFNKMKDMEKTLKLKETGIRKYQIELVLSLVSLPISPHHYERVFEEKIPSIVSSKIV